MRLLNIVLVILVLIIVVSLGRMYLADQGKFSFSSKVPALEISLQSPQYLDKKLVELGFWQKDKIFIHNTVKPTFFTAKKLHVEIVNGEQQFGHVILRTNPGVMAYSYNATMDQNTGVFTISLSVNSAVQTDAIRSEQYSGLLLSALFDLTHVAKDESELDSIEAQHTSYVDTFFKEVKSDAKQSIFLKVDKK
jgi:hypothetical protein